MPRENVTVRRTGRPEALPIAREAFGWPSDWVNHWLLPSGLPVHPLLVYFG